jgi:hypothetical protein
MPVSWTKNDKLIAVHVKEGKVTVSGNDLLLGQNIQVCPPGTLGIPSDDLYFDSSGCGALERETGDTHVTRARARGA